MAATERGWHLPWLAPAAPALAALATRKRPWNDPAVRNDPAALALVLRFQKSTSAPYSLALLPVDRADLLNYAAWRLGTKPSGLPRNAKASTIARRVGMAASEFAEPAASEAAFIVGSLLGVGPMSGKSGKASLDLTVRLARRWGLPGWAVAALAALAHPPATAQALGADAAIVTAVRAAVWMIEPSWLPGLSMAALADAGLDPQAPPNLPAIVAQPYADPYDVPLLPQLLHATERNFRRSRGTLVRRLEDEVARLHTTLAERERGEADRLHERKLIALAELAAGAGHEINTPLAVISGQAQLLLQQLDEPELAKPLQTIVQQTRRVHEILTDLMQFARPARPSPQVFDLALVMREVAGAMREQAAERQVSIDVECPDAFVAFADPRQARSILQGLVRNAVEAVDDEGWVRLRGSDASDGRLQVFVEDSGAGPDPTILDHLFDPFFSGRPAGRGRGLGLPTAWRLAREQGGDVRFEPNAGGPTRFALFLPRAEAFNAPGRMIA